ncbi:MAG: response regulator [Gemmiger sp.]|nr:response regulator [Gemmiger sp.]
MKTILVVEDEKLIRQGLVAMLRRAPVPVETVLEARNGQQALEILHAQPVEVLITDIRMPGMDGIELMQRTKSLPHPPLAIVVSGYDDFNYAVEMLRGGVRDYLLKPVERQKLYDTLQKLENELSTARHECENTEQLRRQALRYLALDGSIPTAEREKLLARYAATFPPSGYTVLYSHLQPGALPPLLEQPIHDIRGNCILIVPPDTPTDADPTARLGQSALHHGLAELNMACAEAATAYRRAYFAPGACCLAWQPPAEETAAGVVEEKEIQKITQLVGVSRWREAYTQVEALTLRVQNNLLTPEAMGDAARALAKQLAATYRTMLPVDEDLDNIADIWRYASVQEYLAALGGWMDAFTQRLAHEFDDYHNKQKIRDAVVFMRNNYAQSLNMAVVSNEVSMNYSLFSLLFKQYVGSNFVSYLQTLRVEEAKRLLTETEYRVGEIGHKVGFTDEKNFLKVFKQNVGITPTEYRKAGQLGKR